MKPEKAHVAFHIDCDNTVAYQNIPVSKRNVIDRHDGSKMEWGVYIRRDIHEAAIAEAERQGRVKGLEEAAKLTEQMLVFADTTCNSDVEIPAAIRALAEGVGE